MNKTFQFIGFLLLSPFWVLSVSGVMLLMSAPLIILAAQNLPADAGVMGQVVTVLHDIIVKILLLFS